MSGSPAGGAFHALAIARIVQETPDARSFVLGVPEPLRARFAYRAGQFLTFQIPWAARDARLARCYSLSSAPECDPDLVVTVKRVDDGRVSNWFHDQLAAGDVLRVLPPAGRFVLRPASERPLALLGGGSGITPIFSLLKSMLATRARRARLVYANRDRASIIFREALDGLVRRHPDRVEIVHHLDDERGFLDADGVRRHLNGLEEADFYLCGPGPFMTLVEGVLGERGVPRERIFIERFVSPPDGELPVELGEEGVAAPAPAPAAPAAGLPSSITVHLDGRAHDVPYTAGDSLLVAARKAGLSPPFACEEGFCASCMAKLVRGSVEMAACHALEPDEIAEGWILTCQARPTTAECEVRYD